VFPVDSEPRFVARLSTRDATGEALTPALSIGVLIPTYRRPQQLRQCLIALAAQSRRPDEVIIVTRENDDATAECLEQSDLSLNPRIIRVPGPGVVAALNTALSQIDRDIVAFTDDDSIPWPDWLLRIEQHFIADPRVAGVGGRDWCRGSEGERERAKVGRVQWWGRLVGNHHLGVGPPREVDLLKGVNMSFRRAAVGGLRFDTRLLGRGAQVHNELGFSLALRRAGWRLIYDPAVAVDHVHGPRVDGDDRGSIHSQIIHDAVHNETLALLDHLPTGRRVIFLAWAAAIGTRAAPGLAQWVRFVARDRFASRRLLASLRGRWSGWRCWQRTRHRAPDVTKSAIP
jgi:GT2 family glycosyltransferase